MVKSKMNRIVEPELLDALPPDDPRAVRSRRDLSRVNTWMRSHHIMAAALRNASAGLAPKQIIEVGAGDGCFLFRVAERLSPVWPEVRAVLLDRQKIVSPETLAAFARLGWGAEAVVADVFDWSPAPDEIVVANLFLHHFEGDLLRKLFRVISGQAKLFVAVEPRRAAFPLFCSKLLWAIGCNAVTRHDAVVSVRAGFAGSELSAFWPEKKNWQLTEQPAGVFSHLFIARRRE
jgi:hypothetical protein